MIDRREFLGASLLALEGRAGVARAAAAAPIDVLAHERARVLRAADVYLKEAPITITATSSPRSAGGKHDYFSEGDYWWPDPKNPAGPYVVRDGESNPGNFNEHRKAMWRLSLQVPALAAAWIEMRQKRYADHAVKHLAAWFIDAETRMNPSLLYGQAVHNKETGRSFGVIDTLHLVEVARAASVLEETGALRGARRDDVKKWFSDYLTWMNTHPYGTTERDYTQNHACCWALQAAEFARLVGNTAIIADCKRRFKTIFLPVQMAPDGSFPLELKRTKPYGYSLFNVDILSSLCQNLSTPEDNLWTFTLPDGRGMRKAMEFIYPYVLDKERWPYAHDVMFWADWPVRQPWLLFGGLAYGKPEYIDLWKKLDGDPKVEEVIRNFPVRQPVLWVDRAGKPRRPGA